MSDNPTKKLHDAAAEFIAALETTVVASKTLKVLIDSTLAQLATMDTSQVNTSLLEKELLSVRTQLEKIL